MPNIIALGMTYFPARLQGRLILVYDFFMHLVIHDDIAFDLLSLLASSPVAYKYGSLDLRSTHVFTLNISISKSMPVI